jgi:mycothiol synthase
MNLHVRTFEDRDYERLSEVLVANDPDSHATPATLRFHDAIQEPRIRSLHLVAADPAAGAVGFGRVMHVWWAYHPRRYRLQLDIDPAWQRHGIGSHMFDRLLAQLIDWDAELVRSDAPRARQQSIAFLEQRGFREWRQRWESVLEVAQANLAPLLHADQRVANQGTTITTFATEARRRGTDRLARNIYDTELVIARDEPGNDPDITEDMSFERFVSVEIETPDALPDGHFLALDSDQLVAVSRVMRDLNHPHILRQGFTGTHPEYRGQGLAQALKLRTIQFARDHGYREIRTSNDFTNEPMLHINDAIGFRRESPRIILERRLDAASDG